MDIQSLKKLETEPFIKIPFQFNHKQIKKEIISSDLYDECSGYDNKSDWLALSLYTKDGNSDDHFINSNGAYSSKEVDLLREKIIIDNKEFKIDRNEKQFSLIEKFSNREKLIYGNNLYDLEVRMSNPQPTPYLKKIPTLLKIIEQQDLGIMGRVRLTRLMPGGMLDYHKHFRFFENTICLPQAYIVIHFILETNPESIMVVKNDDNIVFEKHFKEGEVWFFNSWQDHKIYNYGDTARTHILCFLYSHKNEELINYIVSLI